MKWIIVVAVAGVGAFGATTFLSGAQDPDIGQIMQRKLDHAHAILEALIVEDYETLEESAVALQKLSQESEWFVLQTPEYTQRSASFRHAVAEIEASAKAKNLEGAALGYVDMTLKCVQCHQMLRGTQMAGEFGPALRQNTQLERRSWWETVAVVIP